MEPARLNTPLKQALAAEGRRQTWLADQIGVDARQVWGWVNGLHVPQQPMREKIAEALQRPVSELFPPAQDRSAA